MNSFRSVEVQEGHTIADLQWNETGSQFLVAPATLNARLYDRDGHMIADYVKGDPYILDMQHTKGHVAAITNLSWDAENSGRFVTSSVDTTVRIWNVERTDRHLEMIRAKNQKNMRVPVTCMTTSPWNCGRNLIVAGCRDGSIQVWPMNGNHRLPATAIRGAHRDQSDVSCVRVTSDGNTVISRGTDDTLKFWDLRKPQQALHVCEGLENIAGVGLCLSPDERIVVTGTTVRPGSGMGKLLFYDMKQPVIEEVHQIDVCSNSVVSLLWHPKLNQIFVGCGDKQIRVFHSPMLSQNGVLMGKSKNAGQRKTSGYVAGDTMGEIYMPDENDVVVAEQSAQRKKNLDRRDPIKSKKPDLPPAPNLAKGAKGQVGSSLSQHLVRNMIIVEKQVQDPREALLKYAEQAKADPIFFGDAYKLTQPKVLLAEDAGPEEEAKKRLK